MPRELIDTGRDKRFTRRNPAGQFDTVVDVGQSLARDRKQRAQRTVKAGEGDRGDQARAGTTKAVASKPRSAARRGKRKAR
jgi:hypothetical protein